MSRGYSFTCGPPRVALGRIILEVVAPRESEFPIFLDGGTLLGTFRNGKMIPHDDDCDYGIYVEDEESIMPLLESLKSHLDAIIPSEYKTRIITSYTKKIEVFSPVHGSYQFKGAPYHNVTVDVTAYYYDSKDKVVKVPHYQYEWFETSRDNILPITSIVYAGHTFPAPANAEGYLTNLYGYIWEGTVFDRNTKKYKKKDTN